MKTQETQRTFEQFAGDRYKVTIYHGSNVMEIEELIRLSWWKSLWRSDGQEYIWKRIYFGHITPLEEFVSFYHEVLTKPNKQ